MNKRYKPLLLSGAVILGTMTATHTFTNNLSEEKELKSENTKLRAELKQIDAKLVDSRIEKLKEINKENTKLVIYESNKAKYSKTIQDDSWFPIPVTLETTYSYKVTIDLSKAKIITIKDTTYVEVNYNDIKLDVTNIDMPKIYSGINLINQFKSKKLNTLTSQILSIASKEIDNLIIEDFNSNKDTFKTNLNLKLNSLYDDMDVYTKYKGDVKELTHNE